MQLCLFLSDLDAMLQSMLYFCIYLATYCHKTNIQIGTRESCKML